MARASPAILKKNGQIPEPVLYNFAPQSNKGLVVFKVTKQTPNLRQKKGRHAKMRPKSPIFPFSLDRHSNRFRSIFLRTTITTVSPVINFYELHFIRRKRHLHFGVCMTPFCILNENLGRIRIKYNISTEFKENNVLNLKLSYGNGFRDHLEL
ncbi:hypothetical protein NQ317_010452 [Molorchus minor]|uniref:Uncharacterized protein n=1 Tax=Molorchus minor TaxID=1323400 RepID=A0ABQ9JWX2_9CUCU|nr:hypothetical protein NQ317_010452 [Molorchus minor]